MQPTPEPELMTGAEQVQVNAGRLREVQLTVSPLALERVP